MTNKEIFNSNNTKISLKSIGVNSYAWYLKDCNLVAESIVNNNKIILGGDMLIEIDGEGIKHTYTSWSYNNDNNIDESLNSQKSLMSFYKFLEKCELNNFGGLNKSKILINFVVK
jgi:hypothetical protein